LILQLYDIGCIMFGNLSRHRGNISTTSTYANHLQPQIFHQILNAYADILKTSALTAGIPYGSLPTATGLALRLNRMIFPQGSKAHGTRRLIEGNHPGETVVVVDDILISGKSAMEGAQKLKSWIKCSIVVFMDHEQG